MFDIKQFTPQETCLKCDGCCRFAKRRSIWQPAFLDPEVKMVFKDFAQEEMFSSANKANLLSYKDSFICAFFDSAENKCKIYKIRPLECRLYPFLINKTKETIYLAVDLKCPFAKDKSEDKIFKDYVDYLNNFLSLPVVSFALRQNLRLFADYGQEDVKNLSTLVF